MVYKTGFPTFALIQSSGQSKATTGSVDWLLQKYNSHDSVSSFLLVLRADVLGEGRKN